MDLAGRIDHASSDARGDGPLDLGTTGGTSRAAFGISGSRIYVVGISNNADEDRGFLWDGSTMLELESLGGQESRPIW
ncbi:MAG: hypothetical protein R2839_01700 [Thermomicrobiales bacterium]